MRKNMLVGYRITLGALVCFAIGTAADRSVVAAQAPVARGGRAVARPVSAVRTTARPVATPYVRQPVEEAIAFDDVEYVDGDWGYDPCCSPDPCGFEGCNLFGGGFWLDLDFLLWWRDGRDFPALLTTQPNNGVLPAATVLFGGSEDEPARPGGRLEFGLWLDPCQRTAVGVRYLAVGDAVLTANYDNNDVNFLARPFLDVSTNPPTPTAFPVINAFATAPTTGRLDLRSESKLQAGDVFFLWTLRRSPFASFGFLAGYQAARIDENLLIESLTHTGGTNQSIAVSDLFDAQNEFHGGMFGLRGDYRYGQFGLELAARCGFGNMRQNILIAGSTVSTDANGGTTTRDSGLLAQASTNGGLHEQDKFSFMNESGVRLAFYPTEQLKLSVGYSLMYWSSVVRPGPQIDTAIDGRLLTALPPADATRPAFGFNPTSYLVQGLTFGAELRF